MNARLSPHPADLEKHLQDARERTLALLSDFEGSQWLGPRLAIVNPPLWELGHLGWFQERWCLRYNASSSLLPSILPHADELYDSAVVAHDTRWDLPLPNLDRILAYLDRVLQRVLEKLQRGEKHLDYFSRLALFHEDMHGEAFYYTRQTLAYSRPPFALTPKPENPSRSLNQDAAIPGGKMVLGATADDGFVFDNEKWAHEVEIKPFKISRSAVSNREFAGFVEDGGYQRRALWSEQGWRWRREAQAATPVYWIKESGQWMLRHFDEFMPLPPDAAVIHVNWFEAEAYCRWAGRRLPTEPEWEMAAATESGNTEIKRRYPWGNAPPAKEHANLDGFVSGPCSVSSFSPGDSGWGCRQMFGNVWEWTQDWFLPYPGFAIDPYQEYSQPWFGDHKVLRGGCFATRARLLRNTWRNFYTPDRRDVFAGFRTCALESG
ncbi:MAG TPA: selenoneine synthase SenA [Burkholderiales bacterium]|nr:selenoneine synthase SenA [Burkholderiales bacterium]